jgi:hypothetical protein
VSCPPKTNQMNWELAMPFCLSTGLSVCLSVCLSARIEWNNRGQPETPARRKSRVSSVRRFEFLQPIAVLAAARYSGAATTYSLLSPKISKASSRIDRSQLWKDRATANATAFVVLDLRFWHTHPIQFPIDVFPTQRERFRRVQSPP